MKECHQYTRILRSIHLLNHNKAGCEICSNVLGMTKGLSLCMMKNFLVVPKTLLHISQRSQVSLYHTDVPETLQLWILGSWGVGEILSYWITNGHRGKQSPMTPTYELIVKG